MTADRTRRTSPEASGANEIHHFCERRIAMRIARVISVLSLVAAASFSANAQIGDSVDVHIPYTVKAGNQQLPPGNYRITQVPDTDNVFAITNRDTTRGELFVSATPVEKSTFSPNTDVVIRSDGHGFYLDQVWMAGSERGFQFTPPDSSPHSN
jgi:hypothetical protein